MRFIPCTAVLCGILLFCLSCKKEYSSEGKMPPQPIIKDSLPTNYPFATGLCDAVTLDVAIGEIPDYRPDTSAILPDSLLLDMPASGNQGSQGSCAAWAVVYGLGNFYNHITHGKSYSDTGNLSPKFTYNQIAKGDCGCTSLIDNLYLLREEGAPSLGIMPYDPAECALQPDSLQFIYALPSYIPGFGRVNMKKLALIKKAIAENKPVAFAIKVDDGFKQLTSPYIWNTSSGAGESHAMVVIGYDNNRNALRILNSWSTGWADNGMAWIDYDFFLNNVEQDGFVVN